MRYHEIQEYETKAKQQITFNVEEDIEGDNNRGFKLDKLTAYVDGKEVGYIKIENIPKMFDPLFTTKQELIDSL